MEVKDVNAIVSETEGYWQPWRNEAEKDYKFYVGKSWDTVDTSQLPSDYPRINMNIVKKPVDTIIGHERQNRTDLKIFPVEGGDEIASEIQSQLTKHTFTRPGSLQAWQQGCMDSWICGLGWVQMHLNMEDDTVHGDIQIINESPLKMMLDPYCSKVDCSDAAFVIRRSYITKDKARAIWPEKMKEIDDLPGGAEQLKTSMLTRNFGRYDSMMNVVEYWYRDRESIKAIVDLEINEFVGELKEGEEAVTLAAMNVDFPGRFVEHEMQRSVIKVCIVSDDLILYEGLNPYGIHDTFPFIPIFTHFLPSVTDWVDRVQGLVRKYHDIQLEKNKRRSQAMYTAATKHLEGYWAIQGQNMSVESLKGGARLLRVPGPEGTSWGQIRSPEFPATQIQLEQLYDMDATRIGENADLLGSSADGSSASAPGVTLQLRQRQGLTAIQEGFDNHSFAYRQVGQYHVKLVNKNYSRAKIERICGEGIPFVKAKKELKAQLQQVANG